MTQAEFIIEIKKVTKSKVTLKNAVADFQRIGEGFSEKNLGTIIAGIRKNEKWQAEFIAKLKAQQQKQTYLNKRREETSNDPRKEARKARRLERLVVREEGKKFRRLDKGYSKSPVFVASPTIVY